MRFKASLRMPQWKSFWAHLVMMERVGKSVALVFTDASVRALVQSEADTVMQYAALHTQALFETFRCESRMNNVIAVEVRGNGVRVQCGGAVLTPLPRSSSQTSSRASVQE